MIEYSHENTFLVSCRQGITEAVMDSVCSVLQRKILQAPSFSFENLCKASLKEQYKNDF